MAKKIENYIKLQVPAGAANPSPPVGPALGQHGLNIMEFCKAFNAQTQDVENGMPLPVIIAVYTDKSFTFEIKTPPAAVLLKKAAGVQTVTTQDLMNRRYESVTHKIVVSAATSGNHGRALAWGARMFGCRCVVYMNEGVSVGRERAIADSGAEVVRVQGNYDQAVIRSYKDAETLGYFVISDYKSAAYPNVPRDIMQGYAMVADEIIDQFIEQLPPTHVFVPGGGGRLAGAICGHLWERYTFHRPRVIIVEPTESACLYQSALQGHAVTVSKEGRSVMDGLVVESASPQAWTVLSKGAFAFLTIPDAAAIDAMQQAASGVDGDLRLVIGDTGIAGWAGFLAVTSDEHLRRQLDLNTSSRVVIIATEGATDPKVYENIVGTSPARIDIKRI